MFCKECGNKLDDDAKFCPKCGVGVAKLESSKGEGLSVVDIPSSSKKEGVSTKLNNASTTHNAPQKSDDNPLASIGDSLRSMGYKNNAGYIVGSGGLGLCYFVLWKFFGISLLITIPILLVLVLFFDACVKASYKANPDEEAPDEEAPDEEDDK